MIKVKPKKCSNPDCDNMFTPRFKTTEKYCSYKCHTAELKKPKTKKKPIPKMSKKRSKESRVYSGRRIVFLSKDENKFCKIRGTDCTIHATTIEHSRKRIGYADEEKRFKGISLYLDEDYWIPACLNCNLELENNTELSRKHQISNIHGGKKF